MLSGIVGFLFGIVATLLYQAEAARAERNRIARLFELWLRNRPLDDILAGLREGKSVDQIIKDMPDDVRQQFNNWQKEKKGK